MRTLISIITLVALIALTYRIGELEGMLAQHNEQMIIGMRCVGDSIDEFNR